MRDFYWRRDNFETLPVVAAAAEERGYPGYAAYCRSRERGLRGEAFAALGTFVSDADGWPLERRAAFADWLLGLALAHPGAYDLLPQPLRARLVEPTLAEWGVAAPDDPRPWRWRPAPDGPRRALTLDPDDQVARLRLAGWVAGYLDYAVHELPLGYLGSDPAEDRALGAEGLAAARGLRDARARDALSADLAAYDALIASYADYRASGADTGFEAWAVRNLRPYAA